MKVCLINNLYKPYNRGGTEVVVELIIQGLIKQDIEVVVISTRPFFVKTPLITDFKVKNYYLPSWCYNLSKLPIFIRLFWHLFDLFDFNIYCKVKNILKKEQPDVVITHNLKGLSYLLPKIIKKLKIKHLHYLHDIQLIHPSGLMFYGQEQKNQKVLAKIYQAICQKLFNSPDIIISPSKWLLDYHKEQGFFLNSEKIVLANPMLIPTNFVKSAKSNIFQFFYVGQIEEHKGIIFLLKIFNELIKKTKQKIQLTVIGNGTKLAVVKKMISNNCVSFLGRLDRKEVIKHLVQADCLIVPSFCYENSPTVIYEAFSLGLPVIASRIGGITELMKNSPEMLFEPGNKKELIDKMLWTLINKKELTRMGQQELVVVKDFYLEKYLNKLLMLINKS
ncbi:MAG: glycosyltransferase [Patescibacteria group bacterium]|nr:glycosyltransferase [Patescibacteria group bacterium]MBU1870899.1 glycosyltransferase [Patescibacteria group bacterium]